MSYEKAVREFGPCGIDCSRCVSYKNGDVVKLSRQLKESLVNFEHMASRLKDFAPVFNDYEQFFTVLEHFSKGACTGCRYGEGEGCYAACAAKSCHKTQKVDFCFQCSQYPCNENPYPEALYKKWKDNNDKMRNEGVDAFYHEQKNKPRY